MNLSLSMTTKEIYIPGNVTLYSYGIVISVVKSSNLKKAWNRESWMVSLDADHGENYANDFVNAKSHAREKRLLAG